MNNQSRSRQEQDFNSRDSQSRQRGNNRNQWSQQGYGSPYSGNTPQWRERNEDRDYNNQWRPFDSQDAFSQTPGESRYSGMQNRQYEPGDQGYQGNYGSPYSSRHTDSSNEWEQQNDFGSSNRDYSDRGRNYNTQQDENQYGQYGSQEWGRQGQQGNRRNQQGEYAAQGRGQGSQDYLSNHGSQFNERGNDNPQGNWGSRPQQRYDNSYGRQGQDSYNSGSNQQGSSRMGSYGNQQGNAGSQGNYGNQYGSQGGYAQGSEGGYGSNQGSWWQHGQQLQQQQGYQQNNNKGRGPKGYTRSDERITESINDQLADDIYLDASDIEVQVISGEVILSGTVESRQNKRYAEDLVESISGVKNVENRLRLKSNEEGSNSNKANEENKEGRSSATGNAGSTGSTGNTANSGSASERSNNKVKATQE